jgi:hypothetical protein
MAGLFFCLASTRCRAFILSCCNTTTHKRLQRIFCYQCNYTAKTQKPFTGLYSSFSVDLTYSSAHNTAAIQAACAALEGIPSSAAPPPIPDTTATPDAVQVSTAAYYNKVYKRSADNASPAGSAPIMCGSLASAAPGAPAEGVSVSTCTGSARRLAIWHPPPGRAVQQRGSAEPLAALAAALFGLSPDSQ